MLRFLLAVNGAGALLVLLASCASPSDGAPSMAPIGEGLRFLGVALVVAVLVAVIGLARRGGGGPYG
ncbi:MAG: hypothetical protein ABF384_01265 [Verrucomicrobiales bacterium]